MFELSLDIFLCHIITNIETTLAAAKGLDQDEQEKDTGKYIRRERYAGS